MIRLLMLDADRRLIAAVTRALASERVHVTGVESLDAAREVSGLGKFDAVLLDYDAFDLRDLALTSARAILLTTTSMEVHLSAPFASARLLHKPFTSTQLLAAVRDVCARPWSESLRLLDVLRRAHGEQRSCVLDLGDGELFLEAGEIIHARFRDLGGHEALVELLAGSTPAVRIRPPDRTTRTITEPFQDLMLEILRVLEEREGSPTLRSGVHTLGKERPT